MKYYLGVKACGCVTAGMVDDITTTATHVADFAKNMAKTNRRVETLEVNGSVPLVTCKCIKDKI